MKSPILLPIFLLIFLLSCGGDDSVGTSGGGNQNGNVAVVEIRDNFFQPRSLQINPGTTVRWVFRGNMNNHSVTENDGRFDSGFRFRQEGDTFERHFGNDANNQTFLYHCITHWMSDGMQGSIRVGSGAPDPPPRY